MNKMLEFDAQEIISDNYLKGFKDKQILITGASGLLGIHFISMLKMLKFNFECVLIINSNPTSFFISIIDEDDRFTYFKYDLSKVNIQKELDKYYFNFDIILHLATYGQPSKFMENEIKTIKLNTTTTMELFELLKPKGKFLYISSSEVYSGLTTSFHKEQEIGTTTPEHSRACYIEGKRCGEAICNIYHQKGYNVKIMLLTADGKCEACGSENNIVRSSKVQGIKRGVL